jgi:hypothetical protein
MSDETPKCLYCNEPAGYYQNPQYKAKRAKKFCSKTCGVRHRLGYVHSEVIKSKIPEGVLLDPEDRIRALELVGDHINSKWSYSFKGDGQRYISTTLIDREAGVIHKKWKGREWTQIKRKEVWLHRFVLGVGEEGDVFVIHLNGDYSDFRKSNLKVVTQEEATILRNTERTEDVIIDGIARKKMVFDTKHGIREVLFDPEDWDVIKKYPWGIKHKTIGLTDYAQAHIPHPDGSTIMKRRVRYGKESFYETKRVTTISMHRLILGLGMASAKDGNKGIIVDHADHNGLNNCRDNIRPCDMYQNAQNKRIRKNSAIPYKGVKYSSDYRKNPSICKKPYQVQINFEKKRHHLGLFADLEEAARAYDAKAKELHGEYAYLNFPDE